MEILGGAELQECQLTKEVSGLLWLAGQWRPDTKLVLCHDSELVFVVFGQPGHHVGALFWVIGDVDP